MAPVQYVWLFKDVSLVSQNGVQCCNLKFITPFMRPYKFLFMNLATGPNAMDIDIILPNIATKCTLHYKTK